MMTGMSGPNSSRNLNSISFVAPNAHAVLYHRKPHEDALRSWAKKLIQTKPFKLVAVALANKMARIVFAIMRGKTSYSAVPA
jgi:transposase